MAVCLKAVHDHADSLRASVAYANNDLRLGANEAPPAIISVFVGDTMTKIIDKTVSGSAGEDPEQFVLEMGVAKLPQLAKDNTDRNRTSPFAFTGNKFEYRAVGSSANCAVPMTMLNAAVADALQQMTKRLKARLDGGTERDEAVLALLREVFAETAPIRFEGNGYGEEWKKLAAKRGLSNLADTPSVLEADRDPGRSAHLRELGIFSELELSSRQNVAIERYIKQVTLEAETLAEMLTTMVVPAGERQLAATSSTWHGVTGAPSRSAAGTAKVIDARIQRLSDAVAAAITCAQQLETSLGDLSNVHDEGKRARRLADEVRPMMMAAREASDRLENLVDDDLWPLPKYREMLFIK
jgi:glutamine synthetase